MTAQFYENIGSRHLEITIANLVDDTCQDNFDKIFVTLIAENDSGKYEYMKNRLFDICSKKVDVLLYRWRLELNIIELANSGNRLALLFEEVLDDVFDCFPIKLLVRSVVNEFVNEKKEKNVPN